jgi:flavin reductase (DIM6/NTAB) family NADH-FMN oxidoreductase RutF
MKIDPANLEYRYSFKLLSALVTPRPIFLISTISQTGVLNTAPYALLTCVCVKPMLIGFSVVRKRDGSKKDTQVNIEYSKDFVMSVVTESLAEQMNQASTDYPSDVSEFKETGLTPMKADLVKSPMVAESPVNMECRLVKILDFGDARITSFVIGEVIRVHIKDDLWVNDDVSPYKLEAIGRLGDAFYCRTTDIFEMEAPHKEY